MPRPNIIELQAARAGTTVPKLLVSTLNQSQTTKKAASELGVSLRTLYRYMEIMNVQSEVRYFIREARQ